MTATAGTPRPQIRPGWALAARVPTNTKAPPRRDNGRGHGTWEVESLMHHDPNPPEPLRALQFRASVAMGEIGAVIERGEHVSPDATAAKLSAWAFELLSAAATFLAAVSDIDDELGD